MTPDRALFERIVHPTNFDASGEAAFHHALRLGLAAKGQLRLVHADTDQSRPGPEWRSFPAVRRTLSRWGLLEEDAPESAVTERLGLQIGKTDLTAAAPVRTLAQFLHDHPADLIVLGTHVREGPERHPGPSVSEPLARLARIPALFVPVKGRGFVEAETGFVHLRNVLVPIDRTPDPSAAIRMARAMSDVVGGQSRLHLLHVGSDASAPDVLSSDPQIRRLVRQGPVVETIVEAAHEIGADLIVMATHGHHGFLDALRGDTTEQVLRRAGRALLAVPS